MSPKRIPGKFVALSDWLYERGRWVYLLLLVIACISLAALLFVLVGQSNNLRDQQHRIRQLAAENARLTHENTNRISDIEKSRHDLVYNGCVDQNRKHDDTLEVFDNLVKGIKDPVRRAAAETSEKFTSLLIDALAPYQANCEKFTQQRLKEQQP